MMENSSGKHSSFTEKESPEEKAEREARKRKQKEVKEKQQNQMNKWFAIGAVVLLCGLMIGLVVGRQQRKRKSLYY